MNSAIKQRLDTFVDRFRSLQSRRPGCAVLACWHSSDADRAVRVLQPRFRQLLAAYQSAQHSDAGFHAGHFRQRHDLRAPARPDRPEHRYPGGPLGHDLGAPVFQAGLRRADSEPGRHRGRHRAGPDQRHCQRALPNTDLHVHPRHVADRGWPHHVHQQGARHHQGFGAIHDAGQQAHRRGGWSPGDRHRGNRHAGDRLRRPALYAFWALHLHDRRQQIRRPAGR